MIPVATTFFFYLLASLAIVSALLVITRPNPIHSALALIVTLLALAGLYLMLYAPFVAGVQIAVYAGGIMVLFLFVIMLVNLEQNALREQFNRQWAIATMASICLGSLITIALLRGRSTFPSPPANFPESMNTQTIGVLLFRDYAFPFEVASVLLLVAIVGAVVMAKRRV